MHWQELLSTRRPGSGKSSASYEHDRSAFEVDLDRIIFSHPFRRLQDKTQVHPLPEYDFVHTRLTHSLEVSSVGRSLGRKVGEKLFAPGKKYADLQVNSYDIGTIVAAASLAHDLGNPPFGHSGETSISHFFEEHPLADRFRAEFDDKQWADVTNFEGNAEGFRILNKSGHQGLKLTAASLAAFSKYPRESKIRAKDPNRCSHKKYGFFQTERERFAEVAGYCGLPSLGQGDELIFNRHPLAFLVEAADDICYSIIDLEDGCRLGLISLDEYIDLLKPILGERFDERKLKSYTDVNEQLGVLRAMSIGELISQSVDCFVAQEEAMLAGTYDQPISEQIASSPDLERISAVSVLKIYRCREVVEREVAGFEILAGLLEIFMTAVAESKLENAGKSISRKNKKILMLMPQEVQLALKENTADFYTLTMLVIDFVAGMTDSFAVNMYRKIKGISI